VRMLFADGLLALCAPALVLAPGAGARGARVELAQLRCAHV